MSDYANHATLRAAVASTGSAMRDIQRFPTVQVSRTDLAELLAEFDALLNRVAKPAGNYPPDFEEAWSLYPARPGASKQATFKAWAARIKAGTTALEMIEGTVKYAAYCKAERKEGEYIKLPATFYGPGEHFSADWTSPKKPPSCYQTANDKAKSLADRLTGKTRNDQPNLIDINACPS